jgi:hypothetical protein
MVYYNSCLNDTDLTVPNFSVVGQFYEILKHWTEFDRPCFTEVRVNSFRSLLEVSVKFIRVL